MILLALTAGFTFFIGYCVGYFYERNCHNESTESSGYRLAYSSIPPPSAPQEDVNLYPVYQTF